MAADPEQTETHHNQSLTHGAAARLRQGQATKSKQPTGKKRSVVVLRLDEKERAALDHLGGGDALKALLCPSDLCIGCRERSPQRGTRWDAYCEVCDTHG